MSCKIDFFSKNKLEATKAGVYLISIEVNGNKRELYIGESKIMFVRCSQHLTELARGGYLGIENIETSDISKIIFEVLYFENNLFSRRKIEKEFIKEYKPLSQSGVSDRIYPQKKSKEIVEQFIRGALN